MRLLALQISDIHFRDSAEAALARVQPMVSAVRLVSDGADCCIIALTGDIAFSGTTEQYALATLWLKQLRQELERQLTTDLPIHVVAIPGNHDCDFANRLLLARELLLDSMQKGNAVAEDPQTVETCVAVQNEFFKFLSSSASSGLVGDLQTPEEKLVYEYRFPDGGENVRVICVNTAWMSQNPEAPGRIRLPQSAVSGMGNGGGFCIALMHHPVNWFEPSAARDVRRQLQKRAALVLTGHEHEYAARSQLDDTGGALLHVEGAAFQAHNDPAQSAFNALLIEPDQRRFRLLCFSWNADRYVPTPSRFADWTTLAESSFRGDCEFALRPETIELLRDPGIDLQHPTKGALDLDDIFVYPDLRVVERDATQRHAEMVNAKSILQRLESTEGALLVTGSRECGKTCLAKRVFLDALDVGLVPILLSGIGSRLKGDALRDEAELARSFEETYAEAGTAFASVGADRRVIILDDFHRIEASKAASVVKSLLQGADRVLLLGHDLTQQVQELIGLTARTAGVPSVEHLVVMNYGHVRREEMIDRYVQLSTAASPAAVEQLRSDMRTVLDTALGRHYAPAVPIVIIALLQARAFNDQVNLGQSTYAYYYELLIRRALAGGIGVQEYDVSLGYLSELANALFTDGRRREWSEEWFTRFHAAFNNDRMLALRFSDVEAALIDRGVIVRRGASYEFRHGYMRYFFTARALVERLPSKDCQAAVRDLVPELGDEDIANLMLFITHFTKDASVIDPILEHAAGLFAEAPLSTLVKGSVALPSSSVALDSVLKAAAYVEKPLPEAREELLRLRDEVDAEREARELVVRNERSSEMRAVEAYVRRIAEAFRTMQILGQILKNFPGTLDGAQKVKLTEAVYGVGRRVLGSVHSLLEHRAEETATAIVEMLKEEHPELRKEEILQKARDLAAYYAYVSAYGTVQRIAMDVGHQLLEPVYDDIEGRDRTPIIGLISTALRLDRAGTFPAERVRGLAKEHADNPLVQRVLRTAVINHFHLFDVPREIRQEMCAELGIEFRSTLPMGKKKTKLLGE